MTNKTRSIFISILVVFIIGILPSVQAQDDDVTLSLAVWEIARDLFTPEFFAPFEAENPGVHVVLENIGANFDFASLASGFETHLEEVGDYASAADIVLVGSHNMSVEATRAGYFLDLTPLATVDNTLDEADFFAPVWQAFQWDDSLWAMPVAVDPVLLIYSPTAFDAVGLDYPDEFWTFEDLENAIRALAIRDEDGNVTSSPILISDTDLDALFLSLSGVRLYDEMDSPTVPRIWRPELESMMETWAELGEEGLVGEAPTIAIDKVPMLIIRGIALPQLSALGTNPGATLMPGGQSSLLVFGFAVSSGTNYPQEAYALVEWLTHQPEVVNRLLSSVPARQSLLGVEGEDSPPFVLPVASEEQQMLLINAIETSLPLSELRFHEYLTEARNSVMDDGVTPQSALQDAELQALDNLAAAEAQRAETTFFVEAAPESVTGSGDVTLTFGSQISFGSLPNGSLWLEAFGDFAEQDPQVAEVIPSSSLDVFGLPETTDCFYLMDNGVPNLNLQALLPLDPLMAADPTFDEDDILPGVLFQLQVDGLTWAYPLSISPQVLRYNEEMFTQAGAALPVDGWSVSEFIDSLQALYTFSDDPAPFVTSGNNDYLYILISSFGGVPIDFSTNPPTVNLTDENNVAAIRQVLDLAKDGYIHYQPVGATGAGTIVDLDEAAIYPDTFGLLGSTGDDDTFKMVTFPTGSQNSGAIFGIGGAYISAASQYPEACYRLINYLGSRTDLLHEMPARRSQINDPIVATEQGESAVEFFNQYADFLAQSSTVVYPSSAAQSVESSLMLIWVGRAFDHYVLEDANLEAELEEAQILSNTYLECTAQISDFDPARFETATSYIREYAVCAVDVDPSLAPLFGALVNSD